MTIFNDLVPLIITFKLASITTIILFVFGLPLAYWLAFSKNHFKYLIEAMVSMPLILPPTVLGFYLLIVLSRAHMAFTFTGLVIGSVLFSLPFMVNALKSGFEHIPQALLDASQTMGKSRTETLFRVLLPNIKPALLTGSVMSFAHTIGEFGVVLMIGGNIPGETRTASMAIFSEVEALNYQAANFYAMIMIIVSFVILLALYWFNRKSMRSIF